MKKYKAAVRVCKGVIVDLQDRSHLDDVHWSKVIKEYDGYLISDELGCWFYVEVETDED